MSYPYSSINRLQEPHSYTYSQFGGEAFLHDYMHSRLNRLQEVFDTSLVPSKSLGDCVHAKLCELMMDGKGSPVPIIRELLGTPPKILPAIKKIPLPTSFPNENNVQTMELLESVLSIILIYEKNSDESNEALAWVDRLLQRFEVSKKLRVEYLPGFRKGVGKDDDIRLYQCFSLILSLSYLQQGGLQYLSTLLKLNDLLLSLPKEILHGNYSYGNWGMGTIVELFAVQKLAASNEIDLNVE
jgi:hypothetical protein